MKLKVGTQVLVNIDYLPPVRSEIIAYQEFSPGLTIIGLTEESHKNTGIGWRLHLWLGDSEVNMAYCRRNNLTHGWVVRKDRVEVI